LWKGGVAYLVSRACVLAGAAVVAAKGLNDAQLAVPATKPELRATGVRMMLDVLTAWDGEWYLRIIRDGYPRHVPTGVTVSDPEARAAFFPLFPATAQLADRLLPGGEVAAALAVNFGLGALAILLTGLLARRLLGATLAGRAMVLMAVFPGSLALSLTYSEALLLALAAGCLLCLHDRRWGAAGILAALGTATRPNGLALVAACAVAAVLAIRQRREWQALAALALSPLGFLGFQIWLGNHVDEQGVWFRVQREAWNERSSFGLAAIHRTVSAFTHPLLSKTDFVTAVTLLTTILLLYIAWKQRLPWPMLAYCAGVLGLMLLPSSVTARPRFLYTAFPLLISLTGWWWGDRVGSGKSSALFWDERGDWWSLLIGACCAGIVTLTGVYGAFGAMP
jgi:4-amino-4-deoxy-L-arabinose transferase-like glycosyltransferase